MADNVKSQQTIDDQTSMGAYLLKQAYQQTVTWGSLIAGAYAGLFAGKGLFKKTTEVLPKGEVLTWHMVRNRVDEMRQWRESFLSKIPGLKEKPTTKQFYSMGAGAVIGGMIAGVVLGYEHWKKIKQSQLQVDEITKDISDIEVFRKTDPELAAENKRLWGELHKRESQAAKPREEKPHHAAHHEGKGEGHAGQHAPKSGDHASHHAKHDSWLDKAESESQHAHEAHR